MPLPLRWDAPAGQTFSAFPSLRDDFTTWTSESVELLDPSNVGSYRAERPSGERFWTIFPGTDPPTSWDEAVADQVFSPETPSVVILPEAVATPRSAGPAFEIFVNETSSQSFVVLQEDNSTPVDLTGENVILVFSNENDDRLFQYNNSDLARSGEYDHILSWNWNLAISRTTRSGSWALRLPNDGNRVLRTGTFTVRFAPINQ